jgi:hypothetical protein
MSLLVDAVHMYENVQAPMMEAAAGGNAPVAASVANNPFKTMLQGGSATGHLVTVRCIVVWLHSRFAHSAFAALGSAGWAAFQIFSGRARACVWQ